MLTTLGSLWHPEAYHGKPRRGCAFEGWYFKLVDAARKRAIAVIPGVYHSPVPAEPHSFIQFYDTVRGRSVYHRYPYEAFSAEPGRFDVRIGPNRLSRDGLTLDLDHDGQRITGSVRLGGGMGWPVRLFSPGVMGPLAFLPGLECCHGVLSFDCALAGSLNIDGVSLPLDGGRAYLEKDWGRSFPRGWVWMQTNHFERAGTSLVLSVARVPWMGAAFRGFFAGLLCGGRLYRFATYRGDRLSRLAIGTDRVEVEMTSCLYAPRVRRLRVTAIRQKGAELLHPSPAGMVERLVESLTAELQVRLSETNHGHEKTLFQGVGRWAGLEVGGSASELTV